MNSILLERFIASTEQNLPLGHGEDIYSRRCFTSIRILLTLMARPFFVKSHWSRKFFWNNFAMIFSLQRLEPISMNRIEINFIHLSDSKAMTKKNLKRKERIFHIVAGRWMQTKWLRTALNNWERVLLRVNTKLDVWKMKFFERWKLQIKHQSQINNKSNIWIWINHPNDNLPLGVLT